VSDPEKRLSETQENTSLPLNYAPPPKKRLPSAVQFCFGVLISIGAVFATAFGMLALDSLSGAIGGPIVVVLVLGIIGAGLYQSSEKRAWAAGLWTGIALAVLIDGACWIGVSRSF
jgi:VIT1/CCC1 family predicted Fe2+/Mn2+ transporter